MTRFITKLTPEQEARFAEFRDKWQAIKFCTDPADRPRAEKAIIEVYKAAGHLPPRNIVWCGSPLSLTLTETIILLHDPVKARLGKNILDRPSLFESSDDCVRASVSSSCWEKGTPWERVLNNVQLVSFYTYSLWFWIVNGVSDILAGSTWESVGNSVRDSFRGTLGDSVWASVENSVGANWASIDRLIATKRFPQQRGQHDADWLGVYDFFREVCGLIEETEKLLGLMELSQSAGWYLPYQHTCWISERHNFLAFDESGRLHNLEGPALTYPDGWKIYAVHGVQVPGWVIEERETITAERIESERNAEVRRVMIDQYGGWERYLVDSGAQIIHQDTFGVLYRQLVPYEEPVVMVKVRNSTPEPDGSLKDYFLRVPPEIETARAAVAWTFGLREKQYRPEMET